jgi:hypothetical protein
MKIDPADFLPTLFSAKFDDGRKHLLACRKRIFMAGKTDELGAGPPLIAPGDTLVPMGSWERVLFPVMIDAETGLVRYITDGSNRKWTLQKPEAIGISDQAARLALADAWMGIAACYATMEQLPRIELDTKPMIGPHEDGRLFWCAAAWTMWDRWDKRGLNRPRRIAELKKIGFAHAQAKALENEERKRGVKLLKPGV